MEENMENVVNEGKSEGRSMETKKEMEEKKGKKVEEEERKRKRRRKRKMEARIFTRDSILIYGD